jgi:pentose-5-phosphate-3-epimerase
VAEARRIFPQKTLAVDGGVSLDNLAAVAEAGADYACVGSRIFLHDDPAESFRLFTEKAMQSHTRRDAQRPARG